MELFMYSILFFLVSIFWVLAFVKLQKQVGGIVFFLKHLGGAIFANIAIFALCIAFLDSNPSLGWGGLFYVFLALFFMVVVWFIWSLVLFIIARKKEKTNQKNDGYDDILDNTPLK